MSVPQPTYPPPHIILPSKPHTHTIILLHGTSTTGPEFSNDLMNTNFPFSTSTSHIENTTTLPSLLPSTKFIFPTGITRHVTVLNKALKNAWFDIHSFSDRTLGEDEQLLGLKQSVLYLGELVRKEIEILGGEGEKVIVGGFSQGAAMSAFLLLSGEIETVGVRSVGGWVCLSGWLPFRVQIQEVALREMGRRDVVSFVRGLVGLEVEKGREDGDSEMFEETVFIANGKRDKKVLLKWGEDVRDVLKAVGCTVEIDGYDVDHWWCDDMLQNLMSWIVAVWGEEVLSEEVDNIPIDKQD